MDFESHVKIGHIQSKRIQIHTCQQSDFWIYIERYIVLIININNREWRVLWATMHVSKGGVIPSVWHWLVCVYR